MAGQAGAQVHRGWPHCAVGVQRAPRACGLPGRHPLAVAQVVADALRRSYASPGEFAAALAPSAAVHGFRQGDGMSLLQWLLEVTRDPDSSGW